MASSDQNAVARSEQNFSILGARKGDEGHFLERVPMPRTKAIVDSKIPDTPNERLRNLLLEASALCSETDTYVQKCTSEPSAEAILLEEKTRSADWVGLSERGETMFEFSERWTTDAVEAKMLGMFAYMLKAKRVLGKER